MKEGSIPFKKVVERKRVRQVEKKACGGYGAYFESCGKWARYAVMYRSIHRKQ